MMTDDKEVIMKVLVATMQTQGQGAGDYTWTVEGELVLAEPVLACDNPRCGCDRGFPGLASARATTTALVVDRPDMTRHALATAVEASLERQGWLRHLSTIEHADLVDEHVELIEFVTQGLPPGTVVERQGGVFRARRSDETADEAA
jgi:hypothetical protein